MKQYTKIYHVEYGKGQVVGSTRKGRDQLLMVWFSKVKEHDWVLLSDLIRDSDPIMSLKPITGPKENVSNELQDALTSMFFGGSPQ